MTKTILVIEDDKDFAFLLQKYAKPRSLNCEIDSTGAEWRGLMERSKPALVLLDMELPRMSGLGILRELKKAPKWSDIPVIIFSSYNDREVVEEAYSMGATDYFKKGDNFQVLFDVIQSRIA